MRVLRSSMWNPADNMRPVTTVVTEGSVTVSLEELRDQLAGEIHDQRPDAGLFLTFDLFEMDDGEQIEASIRAMERLDEDRFDRERNMAIMYYYTATILRRVTPGGVSAQTIPSPLSRDEIREVLKQLANHPNYEHQTVIAIAEDFTVIEMKDGKTKVTRKEGGS